MKLRRSGINWFSAKLGIYAYLSKQCVKPPHFLSLAEDFVKDPDLVEVCLDEPWG